MATRDRDIPKKAIPKPAAKGFQLEVLPGKDDLDTAIGQNGFCHPKLCWHKVAIEALMHRLNPGSRHNVRIDGGHVKLNYKGWRYVADTPLHVKRSLMLFDLKRYDEVRVRQYSLRFRRTTKIIPLTEERQEQINAARLKRIANGGQEQSKEARQKYNLRARVEGFSGIV